MIAHRSHQYLPRARSLLAGASLTGASWDTPYRVAVRVSGTLLLTLARRVRRLIPGISTGRYATGMPAGSSVDSVADESVQPLVRKAAAWSWRLLIILAFVVAMLWVIKTLELIVVPVALAMILAALLIPAVDFLDRRGAPRGGAVALVLLTGMAVVGGILTFVVSQFVTGLPGLVDQVTQKHRHRARPGWSKGRRTCPRSRSTTPATPRSRRCRTTRRS